MKLAKKLKKTMGLMLISTMVLSAVPTMAADYDNHWAKEAITKWSDYEVVAGYEEGIFKPNQEVKRAELAAFIVRVFGLQDTQDAIQFTDVPANAWYAEDVAKVASAGIMQGAYGKFEPNGFATREEVAVTLVNAFRLTGSVELNFEDQDQIAAWAKDAVEALVSNGYAKGQAGNKFAPKANITRAEVVQLLDNIVEQLIHKPDTYTKDVAGNVVVNTKDAVLDGIKVAGNVYFAQGIGLGDATLKNTEVTGQLLVSGGGVNSIHLNKAVITGGVLVDTKAPVRLVSENSSVKVTAEKGQNIVLTGSFKEVIVPADVVLELKGATVEKMIVQSDETQTAKITLDKDSTVKELTVQAATKIEGTGKITLLKVEANGVTSTIKPSTTELKPGVDVPKLPSSTGGGGGGGGGGNPTPTPTPTPDPTPEPTPTPTSPYITVESIYLNGDIEIPQSLLKVYGDAITVNLKDSASKLPATIESATVTFGNLEAGDQISTVVNFPISGEERTFSDTVEAGGKVTYQVADLTQVFNAHKSELLDQLVNLGYDQKVEKLLNQFGLSLREDYLLDGSIDTQTALTKVKEIAVYLEAHQDQPDLKLVAQMMKTFLKQFDVTIDKENLSVTGKVTVTTSSLKEATYTVTINY